MLLYNKDLWDKQEDNIGHQTWNLEKKCQTNEFAAAFLMPEAVYLTVLKENTNNGITNTAKIANTSMYQLKRQLAEG